MFITKFITLDHSHTLYRKKPTLFKVRGITFLDSLWYTEMADIIVIH